jgi:hypothetical protein
MTRKVLLLAIVAMLIGDSAVAQSTGQRIVIERGAAPPARQEGMVRVQMSIQLFLPGPTDDSDEADKQRERARRALYNLASKECDVMRDVIARDCRLESININLNRQSSVQMQGYFVNGSMGFQITLK